MTRRVTVIGDSDKVIVFPRSPLDFHEDSDPLADRLLEDTAKTITVTAKEDPDAEDEKVVLTHAFSECAPQGIITTMTVRIDDNDSQGVTISPPSLEITEGSQGFYTVGLDTEPTGDRHRDHHWSIR